MICSSRWWSWGCWSWRWYWWWTTPGGERGWPGGTWGCRATKRWAHLIRSHFWNCLRCENRYNQLSNAKYIRLGTIQDNNLNTRGMSHWHTSHYLHKNSIQYKSATLHQSWWQELSWPAALQVNHTADLHHSTLTLKEYTIAYWCFIVIKQKCVHIK